MKTNDHASLNFLAAFCLLLAPLSAVVAQTSTGPSVPIVTIHATEPLASGPANPGVFTVFRHGNTNADLKVSYDIGGTASNGVDYAAISPWVAIPAGAISNNVIITPIKALSNFTKTVVLQLAPPPTLNPVNFVIGVPSNAVVYLTPSVSNLPPVVAIANPTNGAAYNAPANISLLARASDPAGTLLNVKFFAGTNDLGKGEPVVLDPPGVNGVTGLLYLLNWQNIPANSYSLTAVATDNGGLSTTSAPVSITVLPHTNLPPVVRITSPPSGSVFRAPMDVPIYAYAADPDGMVTTVQFFAGGQSIGFGQPVTAVPPPLPPGPVQPPILIVVPTNYWDFIWSNPPFGTNITLTAAATGNNGLSSTSAPVLISILPPLPLPPAPPTNIVSIVATDPLAIEGTNCWTWPGPASPVAAWNNSVATLSNWFATNAPIRLFTNCGPKDATFTVFRGGATNSALAVTYAIGGTATNGIDYVALPGTVTIPAGASGAAITIVPLDDGPPDITKSVVLTLVVDATGANYLVGYPRAAAAIILDSQSPRPITSVMPGPSFNLAAAGPNGAWFHVEYSTDLIKWTPICTNQVVNGNVDFVDPEGATAPARFYRAVPEAGPPQ
jgi:hypothetical protein